MRFKTIMAGLILVFCFLDKITSVDTQLEEKEPCKNKLICQGSHNASAGENVTLDCHTEPQCDVTDKSVTWEFGHEIFVLVYRSEHLVPDDQAERFKGRAEEGITWNPAEGKLAVKIIKVNTTDAGEYTCSVGVEKDKVSCKANLTFKQKQMEKTNQGNQTNNSEPTPGPGGLGPGAIIAICIVAALLLIGFIVVGVIIYCRRQRQTNAVTNRNYGPEPVPGPNNDDDTRIPLVPEPGPNNDHDTRIPMVPVPGQSQRQRQGQNGD